jgi:hypothetical protein
MAAHYQPDFSIKFVGEYLDELASVIQSDKLKPKIIANRLVKYNGRYKLLIAQYDYFLKLLNGPIETNEEVLGKEDARERAANALANVKSNAVMLRKGLMAELHSYKNLVLDQTEIDPQDFLMGRDCEHTGICVCTQATYAPYAYSCVGTEPLKEKHMSLVEAFN